MYGAGAQADAPPGKIFLGSCACRPNSRNKQDQNTVARSVAASRLLGCGGVRTLIGQATAMPAGERVSLVACEIAANAAFVAMQESAASARIEAFIQPPFQWGCSRKILGMR